MLLRSFYFIERWRLASFGIMNTLVHLFISIALHMAFATIFRCCCCCIHSFFSSSSCPFINSMCCPLTMMPVYWVNTQNTTTTHYFGKINGTEGANTVIHIFISLFFLHPPCARALDAHYALCLRKIVLPLLFVIFFSFMNAQTYDADKIVYSTKL